jgi:hypothetical protein
MAKVNLTGLLQHINKKFYIWWPATIRRFCDDFALQHISTFSDAMY